jgi:L-threonylcarbamoyladenylate synthase
MAAYSLGFRTPQEAELRISTSVNVSLKTQILPAGEAAVTAAARCLAQGGLVGFPTETVYGLGADAANAEAIARLYQAKGRPAFNPLIAHVGDLAAARRVARFDAQAVRLAEAFWPGPLTLVLPKTADCTVADLATAGLDTVAIRLPAHPVARAILRAFGGPVVAPSANLSGHVSPTTAAHVESDLAGRIDLIVDGGAVAVGVESTIVGCFDAPMLLRPGGLPRDEIERVLGRALLRPPADAESDSDQPLAPGMLAAHYAPRTPVRLNAVRVEPDEVLLAFGPEAVPGSEAATAVMNLSARGDLAEAAAHLFGYLRALDSRGARGIAVMPVPHHGLGEAINDRLRRAAMGRT